MLLTAEAWRSGGLRGTFLSTSAKAGARYNVSSSFITRHYAKPLLWCIIHSESNFYRNIYFSAKPFLDNVKKCAKRNVTSVILDPGNVCSFLVNFLS